MDYTGVPPLFLQQAAGYQSAFFPGKEVWGYWQAYGVFSIKSNPFQPLSLYYKPVLFGGPDDTRLRVYDPLFLVVILNLNLIYEKMYSDTIPGYRYYTHLDGPALPL
jgi:hypothetical protein